ncbi:hypothetical protein J6590_016056 [Homalodisca vitripennis]|nr:hypothetical protein J6590_016056 [Homalodisca vitripennis]
METIVNLNLNQYLWDLIGKYGISAGIGIYISTSNPRHVRVYPLLDIRGHSLPQNALENQPKDTFSLEQLGSRTQSNGGGWFVVVLGVGLWVVCFARKTSNGLGRLQAKECVDELCCLEESMDVIDSTVRDLRQTPEDIETWQTSKGRGSRRDYPDQNGGIKVNLFVPKKCEQRKAVAQMDEKEDLNLFQEGRASCRDRLHGTPVPVLSTDISGASKDHTPGSGTLGSQESPLQKLIMIRFLQRNLQRCRAADSILKQLMCETETRINRDCQ